MCFSFYCSYTQGYNCYCKGFIFLFKAKEQHLVCAGAAELQRQARMAVPRGQILEGQYRLQGKKSFLYFHLMVLHNMFSPEFENLRLLALKLTMSAVRKACWTTFRKSLDTELFNESKTPFGVSSQSQLAIRSS